MKKITHKKHNLKQVSTFVWVIKTAFAEAFWPTTLYVVSNMFRTAANIFSYYATAKLSANLVFVITSKGSTDELKKWFIFWACSSFTGYMFYRISETSTKFTYFRLVKWSTRTYMQQLGTIDMADYYDNDIRNEINRINTGAEWRVPETAYNALNIVQSLINTIATVLTVGVVAWWLIPLFIVLMIPGFVYESKLAKINWFMWHEKDDSRHIFFGIQSLFSQAKKQFEIRALTAQPKLLGITNKMNKDFYNGQEKKVHKLNGVALVTILGEFSREVIGQGWLITRAVAGKISLEQYFFYLGIIFRLDGAISGLFSSVAHIQDGLSYCSDYKHFMRHTPKLADKADAQALSSTTPPYIEFIDATFTYPGATKPTFENLNLSIQSGEKVALVGENGAGKSTIIKLLMRFYELDSGKLLINGVDIHDIAIDSWYRQVATLFQDFNQYPLTVAENISISGEAEDQKEIKRASDLAGSTAYIKKLPLSYNTYLDPAFKDGVEPSGGMWQRIALARAFYRKANMIILDEPTSAIDAKAEYEIFNNIFDAHDGMTALIVSHRFSTVRKADRIVVLGKGNIIEDGTHKELLKKSGEYASMFNTQAEGYR